MSPNQESFVKQQPVLASLMAFAREGLRPRSLLARTIVTVLAIKLIAVIGMAIFAYFSDLSAVADTAGVSQLIGPSSPP